MISAAREQWEIVIAQSVPGAGLWADYAKVLLDCCSAADALEALQVARECDPSFADLDALELQAHALLDSKR